jgi:GST-like protein
MLKFYYNTAPNPMKVALFLEESGLPYEPVPVDTRKGEQHTPAYRAINPNAKAPSIVDADGTVVFDSNAILLYLGEKTGKFMPPNTPHAHGPMYSWLMFMATGVGPFTGQCVHFRHVAPEPKDYPVTRYLFEARRHWGILNDRLAQNKFMLGDSYTIVDMAVWGWARAVPYAIGDDAWERFPHVKRLLDEVNARPAAQRAEAMKTKHTFKTDWDDEARRHMFPHTAQQAA